MPAPTVDAHSPTMRLQLTVRQTGNMPGTRDVARQFDHFPLVIGRSAACDLVLRDESRFVSSNHAVITLADGSLSVRDTSANGVFLNGAAEPLGRGNEMPLRDRDTIGVGDYLLAVAFDADGGGSPDDPFAALIDEAPPSTSAAAPENTGGSMPPPAAEAFDPWRGDEPDWSTPLPSADPVADLPTPGASASHDPFATPATAGDDQENWADWPSDSPSNAAVPVPLPPDRSATPAPHTPATAPHHRSPAAAPRAPVRAGNTSDPLVETLLLHCLDGLMALLRSRSELKQAIRTDVTTLAGTGNNPLKFSRDGREALSRLLETSHVGEYLPPEEAIGQTVDDLALHQVALLEGMKGAVAALLARFDPDSLTERLTADHPIAANIPVTRDAKLWQLFCEHYADIERSARGDFTAVFGREFRKAYERRIRELGREPEPW